MRSYLVAACIFAAQVSAAHADEITLIAPGGIRAPIQKMIPDFERRTGHTVKATFGSGNGTKKQVMSGEAFDVPIVQPPLAEVIATGHVIPESETPLATVAIALAVRKGAPKPDISTPEALKKTLLAAKSVAFPDGARGAAAGVSFDQTLKTLGIAEEMKSKITRAQGGALSMEMLAKGEVEITGKRICRMRSDSRMRRRLFRSTTRRIRDQDGIVGLRLQFSTYSEMETPKREGRLYSS